MGHPFGDLLDQYRARKHGLTQARLALLSGYHAPVITRMAQGKKDLTGPSGRERVVRLITVLRDECALVTLDEANALLAAAGMPPLYEGYPDEAALIAEMHDGTPVAKATALPITSSATPAVPRALTNLPAQLTSFVGREREVAEVGHLLGTTRLLTLTGAGGCGKTRLALEVGNACCRGAVTPLPPFPDGVWLVEFAPIAEPALVVDTLMATFGLRSTGLPARELVTNYLVGKRLLLILDNCEHLIDACADVVQALLHACPRLTVLATSREGLNVPGEVTWRVPSLSAGEAVLLFEERARAIRQGFSLTEQNAASIWRVCARLDHIPLAVELAAARIRSFTPQQIEERLDNAFHLLAGGSRTALPRHQTLRAMIDWSYGLLTQSERILLQRLAVFAGGWTLQAAEALASDTGQDTPRTSKLSTACGLTTAEVPALLDQLVGKSMVQVDPGGNEPRFRFLEVVRQYAREKLTQAGEYEKLRDRHLAYVCDLTDRVNPEQQQAYAGYGQVQEEIGNVRAALEWASSSGQQAAGVRLVHNLRDFWYAKGHELEGVRWAAALLPDPCTIADPQTGADILFTLGMLIYNLQDWDQANTHFTAALPLARQAGNTKLVRELLRSLRWTTPDAAAALAYAREHMSMTPEPERASQAANLDFNLGHRAQIAGDLATAVRHLRLSLAAYRAIGDVPHTTMVLRELGRVVMAQGDYATAQALLQEALDTCAPLRELVSDVDPLILLEMGTLAGRQGDAAKALKLVGECATTYLRIGHPMPVCQCVAVAAGVALQRGDARWAATLLGAADALWQSLPQGVFYKVDYHREYERLLPLAQAALPPAEFERASAKGQQMTLDQAVADVMAMGGLLTQPQGRTVTT